MDELNKLDAYFGEGRRLWAVNPELVVSQRFYEMWEQAQQPRPFAVTGDEVQLGGQPFALQPDRDRIGFFAWDAVEERPGLVVEGATMRQRLLFGFHDGEPLVEETVPQFFSDDDLSFGERLEMVYEIIAWMRRRMPGRNVLTLSRKEYLTCLDAVAADHEALKVRVMRRLKLESIQKMLEKAAEDMAVDELSNQLELPLAGSYAVAAIAERRARTEQLRMVGPAPPIPVPARTPWTIACDLEFITAAAAALAELEEQFVLTFEQAEILRDAEPRVWAIRLPVPETLPLLEGERIPLFVRGGDGAPVGMLQIDLSEGAAIIGRLIWHSAPASRGLPPQLYAKSRRSPATYLWHAIENLLLLFRKDGTFPSPGLNAALGVAPTTFTDATATVADAPPLDRGQLRAWANAVSPANPVVLIQGPPGTGKTHVLEQVLRSLCAAGNRVLVTAPSNTAVDNVCRRVADLPVLRVGNERSSIAADVASQCWMGDLACLRAFQDKRKGRALIFAGTHVGLLREDIVREHFEKQGPYDAIIFDEAGMTRLDEFLLCASLARRLILFGDHQQLPPFPLADAAVAKLSALGPAPRRLWATVQRSALEWVLTQRNFPVFLLQSSYRCQNPRLMRFSSTLFYDARVRASLDAEYYHLAFVERQRAYPAASLRLYRTSGLPLAQRTETLAFEGSRPGLENQLEARLCVALLLELAGRYPLSEITMIAPYRRQVHLIRALADRERLRAIQPDADYSDEGWQHFLHTRIATVDSFQGGESDAVITCYVRSNDGAGIGFVDDPHRVNVAHTRCRREMLIVGDMECLKRHAHTDLFRRMERAIARDGEIIDVTEALLSQMLAPAPESQWLEAAPDWNDGENGS